MKLPHGDRAVIPQDKLLGYALNRSHPHGRTHAALFDRLLGITIANAHVLDAALRAAAREADAMPGAVSAFGAKYEVRFPMTGPRGTFMVSSVWIIPTGTGMPVLVTVYIE